jgi:ABC-type Fe3+ transport system substrate-binding protein
MENKYFSTKDTIYDITSKYEEALDLLVLAGFDNMKDPKQRETIGKNISLEMALQMKQLNVDTFAKNLIEAIESNESTTSLAETKATDDYDLKIEGILPCPVKVPLMEAMNNWMETAGKSLDLKIAYELKSASMGVDWLIDSLEKTESPDVLSDLFISAGFDLFFDKKLIGKFKEQGVFEDITAYSHYNQDFDNEEISLKDPAGQYAMIGVVPAVFLINTNELGDLKRPTSWEDILSEDFENSVSLPIGDFDLFNAILLNIYHKYGEEGVKKLGKSLLKSMHPSEMVKSHIKKSAKPKVTIMPYFFTKMTKNGGPMVAQWPEDGAIISPIFMLSKRSKREQLKPIVDFFASKEVGEILSHNGQFPSVNPEVDNRIPKENKYMWIGWDFINEHDISQVIKKCEIIFNNAVNHQKKEDTL